jgi:hypothetical protein
MHRIDKLLLYQPLCTKYHTDLGLSNRELHFRAQVTLAQGRGYDILPGATEQTDNKEERRLDWKHHRHHTADLEA